MTSPKACLVVILALVNVQAKKGDQYKQTALSLALSPAATIRNHITLTQALGTVGAYVRNGYVLFGLELRAKDGQEPIVNLDLPPDSHFGDALRQIMTQIPGYEYEVVSPHMVNIFPIGAKNDSGDLLNTPVPQFDAISVDAGQILTSPSDYIPELAARLYPRKPGEPYGYGGVAMRSTAPPVTLHLKNTTVREILNAASEAMEEYPPQYSPVGWAYLLQPNPSPAGGKPSWMFVFSAPRNWKGF